MTNPLIPNTFYAGTKANAEEVNENFVSLAEKIQSVETTASANITELESSFETSLNTEISKVTQKCSDNQLENTGTFTNAIIEAPNGIATYETSVLTVKSGLKLVIPNGKDDNQKLKNIVHTVDEDFTLNVESFADGTRDLWITENDTCIAVTSGYYFEQKTEPGSADSTNYIWFNPSTNLLKRYNPTTEEWEEIHAALIGKMTVTSAVISNLTLIGMIEFLKKTDIHKYCDIGIPGDYSSAISLTLGASESPYQAPATGWFDLMFYYSGSINVYLRNSTTDFTIGSSTSNAGNHYIAIPCRRGDIIQVIYDKAPDMSKTGGWFRFYTAEGEVK